MIYNSPVAASSLLKCKNFNFRAEIAYFEERLAFRDGKGCFDEEESCTPLSRYKTWFQDFHDFTFEEGGARSSRMTIITTSKETRREILVFLLH